MLAAELFPIKLKLTSIVVDCGEDAGKDTCQSNVLKIFWLTWSYASVVSFSSSTLMTWRPFVIKTFWNFGLFRLSFHNSSPEDLMSNASVPST